MNKKQKEALVIALAEKGETYREITKKAGVSPNTIKAVLNRAGLDESTSIHSRAFELFSAGKTPLQVAITLNLEAEKAIQYHQQYFMLLGCYEFTKVYLQIKDNPWAYVNLVKLGQNSGMNDGEVIELLKIANGHLPRIKLEYDRLKAELNSLEDEKSNSSKDYHRLCNEISGMETTVDQVEYVLADRRQLLRMAIQSVIELLRLDPQKFHSFYYNQSTIQPENDEEPALVEAERLYEKMLEKITNKIVTDLSDDISVSSFAQKESSEQNSDDIGTSSDYLYAKEERTLSDTEDKGIQRNLFKGYPDVPAASHRMIS